VERSARGEAQPPFLTIFRAPHTKRTLTATLLSSCVLIAYWGLTSWLPAFLATPVADGGAGLTLTKSALWMILIQVGAFFGYTTFGLVADRFGRRPAFTMFMIGASIVVPSYALLASKPAVLIAVGPLVGYFAHGYFSLFGALLAELFPTSIRATAQGFCYNAGRLASAAAPYLIGVAAARFGLGSALAVNAGFFAIAGFVVWLLPETKGEELV
jgi:MFS family permease